MRRFIAGAVCPRCRAVDRIVVEADVSPADDAPEGTLRRRRCVSCGYSDTMTSGSAVEPAGRFARRPSPDVEASPVRVVDSAPAAKPPSGGGSKA